MTMNIDLGDSDRKIITYALSFLLGHFDLALADGFTKTPEAIENHIKGLIERIHNKHIRVEYALDFFGGNYNSVGNFVYIPLTLIGKGKDAVEKAFEKRTGHKRVHIIHYSESEFYDCLGNPLAE